ncbi:MAG: NADH-quinone oxidoreductase subunit NuoG [Magnetococcales bacterium]|nr:NADH-quinone oxidoreductase subunit NuoG [Magnetococcales bacterium]
MPTLIIDNKEIQVKPGTSIMEAATMLGGYIPHFCYHPKLSVAGNCRMCLVEVEKMPKPVVACAMPVSDGMVVRTSSDMAQRARRGVMEFLLINHPLDCPVCDQGGDCSLQDLAMKYGPDRSRFHETKRHAVDKDLGPLIETEMDRCIHCTRCIRFSVEIAGVEEMGATFRGDHMQIGTYVEQTLTSELAGNMAEICPVGALNDKPFHFQARNWELKHSVGLCSHCSVACHLRWDHIDNGIKRVKARSCDAINETWICDKGRYSYDGLTVGRLSKPMVRRDRGGATAGLAVVSWPEALEQAAALLKQVRPDEVAGLADAGLQSGEDLFAFQDFLRRVVGTPHIDHRLRQRDFSGDDVALTRADLLMNTPLAQIERADCIVLVGSDSRYDVPLLNLRVRKAAANGAAVFAIYPRQLNSTIVGMETVVVYPGNEAAFLDEVLLALTHQALTGETPAVRVAAALRKAQRPLLLLGDYAICHPMAEAMRRRVVAILQECQALGQGSSQGEKWNGYNRVDPSGNSAAAQDFGVVPHRGPGYHRLSAAAGRNVRAILEAAVAGEIKVLFLMGADPTIDAVEPALARAALAKAQVIYLGAFERPAVRMAHVVLPGVLIPEKMATLTNCEGRVQQSQQAVLPAGEAKEEWRILRALSDYFPERLGYDNLQQLRQAMAQTDHRYQPQSLSIGDLAPPCDHSPVTVGLPLNEGHPAHLGSGLLLLVERAFYHDDPVLRRSKIMAQLDGGAVVRMCPGDAARLHLGDGERAWISQGFGTPQIGLEMTVKLDTMVPEGVLFGSGGYSESLLQDLCSWDGFVAVAVSKSETGRLELRNG